MKEKKLLKSLLGLTLVLTLFFTPCAGLTSFAATKKLGDLTYVSSNHSVEIQTSTEITTPGGKTYKDNIIGFDASLPDCNVVYNLNKKYNGLTGKIVSSTRTGGGKNFTITFYGDGKKLKTYKSISRDQVKAVSVNVKGVKQLKITATNSGEYANGFVYLVESKLSYSTLKLSETSLTLEKGDDVFLEYDYNNGKSGKATWSSSNKKVAKVSSKGQIIAVGHGTCTITCKVKDAKATATVVVKSASVSGLSVKAKGSNYIQISWNEQDNASGYQVWMYDNDFKEYSLVKTVKNGKTTSARITDLEKKTSYKFKVRSYIKSNGKNTYSDFSKVLTAKTK